MPRETVWMRDADPYLRTIYKPVSLAASTRSPVTVVASATPHTKGAWTELIAATGSLATFMRITGNCVTSSTNTAVLVDIGVGAAASETVVIPNMTFGGNASEHISMVPISIPPGSRVSARSQGAQVSQPVSVWIELYHPRTINGNDSRHGNWSRTVTTYGAVTASSLGTTLTTPGSLNTKSAWTEITSSTTAPLSNIWATFGRGGQNNTSPVANMLVDIGFGAAGSESVLIENVFLQMTTGESMNIAGPTACQGLDLPAGTRLAARYQRDATTGVIDVCLHTNYGKVTVR
jgi:hypothetical protein